MDKPIMTDNAIKYTIEQLFRIANPIQNIKYDVDIKTGRRKVILHFCESGKRIVFNLADDAKWQSLIRGKTYKLTWIESFRTTFKIPVLFWAGKGDLPFVTIINDRVEFNGDIISSAFFMLSRWEEKHNEDLDIHGRFKYKNSTAFKYNFVTVPIVDEYAMLLRKYLQELFPGMDLGKNRFKVKLSHDIDNIRRFKDIRKSAHTFGGDLLKTKSLKLFLKSMGEFKASHRKPAKDPYFLAVYELASLSKRNNVDSAFYFKTSDKSSYDSGYAMKDHIKKCIDDLKAQGFEIGFHPGYYTHKNYDMFSKEKQRLDRVLGYSCYGGRQHYLRFDVNTTWKHWEKAGLKYDSTVGYAEHEGFRCGTCHPFRPFCIEEDRALNIMEIPLIVMDGTLKFYRRLTTEKSLNSIVNLMSKCKAVEGVFTLLWHNTSVCRDWEDWADRVYKKVLTGGYCI